MLRHTKPIDIHGFMCSDGFRPDEQRKKVFFHSDNITELQRNLAHLPTGKSENLKWFLLPRQSFAIHNALIINRRFFFA